MLYNYGKIHESTHPDNESFTLRFHETNFHNTLILLQVDASDIAFVYTRYMQNLNAGIYFNMYIAVQVDALFQHMQPKILNP